MFVMLVDRQVISTPPKLQNERTEELCKNQYVLKTVDKNYLNLGDSSSPSLSEIKIIIQLIQRRG